MNDVTKYNGVIDDVIAQIKVKRPQREDMKQECYIALIEAEEKILASGEDPSYIATICRNKIMDVYRSEGRKIKTESLDEPRHMAKATKIEGVTGSGVTDEQLDLAIQELDNEGYQVICLIYIEGKTEQQTAEVLGLTKGVVNRRKQNAILDLKKYFEENV